MSQDTFKGASIQRIEPGASGIEAAFNPCMDREERKAKMIEQHKQGLTAADIAKKWGVSSYTVQRILQMRRMRKNG